MSAQDAIDWQRQFEQGASHDEQTVERSRENAEAIADRVCREPPADLEKHVKEVAPYLQNRSPEVQLQASGFYMLLSMCRTDAGASFASVRDVLAKAALNNLMAERSRANRLSALARIEPISSSEVFEVFQSTFNEGVDRGYGRLIEPAAVGLARLAESNADSIRILHEYLQHPKGPDFRGQVVTAIGQAQSHVRTLTEDLGQLLNAGNEALWAEAVRTIALLGSKAIELNKIDLRRFVQQKLGTDAAKMAESLLQR